MTQQRNSIYGNDAFDIKEEDRDFFISEIFRKKGRAEIEYENWPEIDLRSHLVEAIDRARAKGVESYRSLYKTTGRRFYMAFVDSFSFGAWSFANENCDFVAVNVGTLKKFLNLFNCLLSDPRSFKNIDNSEIEQLGRVSTGAEFEGHKWNFKDIVPLDSFRKRYASVLALFALDTVITHEVQHLIYGHHVFVNNELRGLHMHDEMQTREDDVSAKYIDQMNALEAHADILTACSAMKEMNYLRDSYTPPFHLPEEVRDESVKVNSFFWGTAERGFATVCYALYGAFFMTRCESDGKATYHPEPAIRLRLALDACIKFAHSFPKTGIRPEVISKLFDANIGVFHSALVNLIGSDAAKDLSMKPWEQGAATENEVKNIRASIKKLQSRIDFEQRLRINPRPVVVPPVSPTE